MEESLAAPRVLASIQAPGYESDRVNGHRAAGFLADRDLVCVPSLARSLLDEAGAYEVLLVPDIVSEDQPAERHKVTSVEAIGLAGADDVVAIFHLALPSGLFVPVERSALNAAEFARALKAADGNLWDVAEDYGAGHPPFRGDHSAILEQIEDHVVTPLPCVTAQICPTEFQVADGLCCWLQFCC